MTYMIIMGVFETPYLGVQQKLEDKVELQLNPRNKVESQNSAKQ